jgi:hypothetical protein
MRFITLITAAIYVLAFASQSAFTQIVRDSYQGSSELSKRETGGLAGSGYTTNDGGGAAPFGRRFGSHRPRHRHRRDSAGASPVLSGTGPSGTGDTVGTGSSGVTAFSGEAITEFD